MKKQKTILIGALALTLGIGMVASPVLAATTQTDFSQVQGQFGNGYGFGKYFAGTMQDTVASTLGLTSDELYSLRVEGKSIAQIANEKGITTENLTNTLTLAKIENINQLFNDGTITQDQKDLMLSQVDARVADRINRTEIGNQGLGQGYGKGMRYNQSADFQPGQGRGNSGGFGFNINNQQ